MKRKPRNAKTRKKKERLGHNYQNIKTEKKKPTKSSEEMLRERNKMRFATLGSTNASLKLPKQTSVPWQDITFNDGYIVIEYQKNFFRKDVHRSKEYLNAIKAHYSFKKVPELQVLFAGNKISKVINEEILFYYIEFLADSGILFETFYQKVSVTKWSRYTKNHYRQHLSFAFQSSSLNKLCELSDSKLPIIPVGELVKTSNGTCQIHHSFLFPVSSKNGIKLIWESVEDGKASYVFKSDPDFYLNTQKVFDYIVGDTINKRETLIHLPQLQQQLRFTDRVLHTHFPEWQAKIEWLANT